MPAGAPTPATGTTPTVEPDYRDVIEASERALKRYWAACVDVANAPSAEVLDVFRTRMREELRYTCTLIERERLTARASDGGVALDGIALTTLANWCEERYGVAFSGESRDYFMGLVMSCYPKRKAPVPSPDLPPARAATDGEEIA
jgi:hypothetical protein